MVYEILIILFGRQFDISHFEFAKARNDCYIHAYWKRRNLYKLMLNITEI